MVVYQCRRHCWVPHSGDPYREYRASHPGCAAAAPAGRKDAGLVARIDLIGPVVAQVVLAAVVAQVANTPVAALPVQLVHWKRRVVLAVLLAVVVPVDLCE